MQKPKVKRFNTKKTFSGRTVKRTTVNSSYARTKKKGRTMRAMRPKRAGR